MNETATLTKNLSNTQESATVKNIILETRNFVRITDACNDAMANRKFVAIDGEPGFGKTTALQKFAYKNANTYHFTVRRSMNAKQVWEGVFNEIHLTRTSVFEKIRRDFSSEEFSFESYSEYKELYDRSSNQAQILKRRPSLHTIINEVIDNLNFTEKNLLILDEAGKFFTPTMLEYLHEVKDATRKSTGIIMSGPNYYRRKLIKWASTGVDGIPELVSRINYWVTLDKPEAFEIKNICEAYGIIDPEIIREFKKYNNFRTLNNAIIEYLSAPAN